MSWRTIVITERCKLDYKMGYLVVRAEEIRRIFLDEIAVLIIENPAVSLTGILLEELNQNKVRVIFCDSKRSPMAELVPYYGSHNCSHKLGMQLSWENEIKGAVWTEVIADKLRKQSEFLRELERIKEADLIHGYINQIEFLDKTNREGHAAKVYFNALFGMDFSRSSDCPINAALNYGYGVILSAFNREIVANGYLTQLGFKHHNVYNHFNLSSDLMEPFRILIDRATYQLRPDTFGSEEKHEMIRVLGQYVGIDSSRQTVLNAIRIYVKSVFDSVNDCDISKLKFYHL